MSCDIFALSEVYEAVLRFRFAAKYFCRDLLVNANVVMLNAKSAQVKVKVATGRTDMSTKLAVDFHRRAPKRKQQAEKGQARSVPHVLPKGPRQFPAPGLSISKLARCRLGLSRVNLQFFVNYFDIGCACSLLQAWRFVKTLWLLP